MADFDSVFNAQNEARNEVWDKAFNAIDWLTSASGTDYSLGLLKDRELAYDPGQPEKILLDSPIDLVGLFQKIDEFIDGIKNIAPPVFPDAPNFFMLNHEVWEEQFMDDIKASLWAYIQSMGIPDASYQNAIFNEDYERNLLVLNDLYNLADAKTGARGFSYPNDWGGALKIDAQVKYQYDRTQLSRTIVKTVTEWARDNYQFSITQGIEHQKAHMDFTYKYCTAFLTIFKDLIIVILETYKSRLAAIALPVEILIKEVQLLLDYVKIETEVDKANETLKQSRSAVQISEALQKYSNDVQHLNVWLTQQYECFKAASSDASALAQSATNSVIGYASK
jgi:hypothetical protein